MTRDFQHHKVGALQDARTLATRLEDLAVLHELIRRDLQALRAISAEFRLSVAERETLSKRIGSAQTHLGLIVHVLEFNRYEIPDLPKEPTTNG